MNWTYWAEQIEELVTNIGMSGFEASKPGSERRVSVEAALYHLKKARTILLKHTEEE